MEGPPPRSSPRVTDLGEWREARSAAEALGKWGAGHPWFLLSRPGLGREGRPVVRIFLRWTPEEPLATNFPVRFNGVPVVLRRPWPSGEDIYLCDLAAPTAASKEVVATSPGEVSTKEAPNGSVIEARVLLFCAPSVKPAQGDA